MKIAFFQPILTAYRLPLFEAIAGMPDVTLTLYSNVATEDYGLGALRPENLPFNWYTESPNFSRMNFWTSTINSLKAVEANDLIVHFADFKYISLFICLIYSKIRRKKFFLHGQGGYKKTGLMQKLVYNFALFFSDGYICYSEFSKKKFKANCF